MDKEAKLKYVLKHLIEQGNLGVIEEAFTSDYLAHSEGKKHKGHAFLKRFAKQLRSAIPDISVLKVEFLVHAGDLVTWQRTLCGTHKAGMGGIPASGKQIKWHEMVVSRFEGEQIAEEWVLSGLMGELLLKQGGLIGSTDLVA